jgi:hypothetical protein
MGDGDLRLIKAPAAPRQSLSTPRQNCCYVHQTRSPPASAPAIWRSGERERVNREIGRVAHTMSAVTGCQVVADFSTAIMIAQT